jgi:hypothetical protein
VPALASPEKARVSSLRGATRTEGELERALQ